MGHTIKAFEKSLEDFWFQSLVILKLKFMKEKILEIHLKNVFEITEAARGKKRSRHFCVLCGTSFGYGYSLRNHIARSVKCQIAQPPMPLDLTFNSGTPAAPFGTQEHFAFCENVPLECRFSYAEWQGPHDIQTEHLDEFTRCNTFSR